MTHIRDEDCAALTIYPSRPLAEDEIRVLHLSPGYFDENIRADLQIVTLGSGLHYEALSYTWGGSVEERSIILDGERSFSITDNLWYALRRLRSPSEAQTFWVDALCINQADTEERNKQVSRMFDIYKAAHRVIVWLGEPSRAAIDDTSATFRNAEPVEGDHTGLSILDTEETSTVSARDRAAFEDLDRVVYNTDPLWWERAWTVQEVLANRNVRICFGSRELPWTDESARNDFVGWADEYQFEQYQVNPKLDRQRMRLLEQCQWIKDLSLRRKRDDRRFTALADIIMRRSVSDPRDKVFSLLGVMNPTSAALVLTDYTRPTWEIFAKVTFAVIVGDASFEILRFINPCQPRNPKLPSWAVDFTASELGAIIPRTPFGGYRELRNRRVPNTVSHSNDLRELRTSGRVLDAVHAVQPLPGPSSALYENVVTEELEVLLYGALIKVRAGSLRNIVADVRKSTSALDRASRLIKDDGDDTVSQTIVLDQDCIHGALIAAFRHWEASTGFTTQTENSSTEEEPWPTEPMRQVRWYAEDTAGAPALLITRRGFIGVGPANILKDDLVALLPGGKRPIILRPSGNSYTFEGFAYIHGTCNTWAPGEIGDAWFQSGLEDRAFCLI